MNNNQQKINWKEVASQNSRELVLTGPAISKQIESDGGINEIVFKMKTLNFFEITKTTSLKTIPSDIAQLDNLTNLVLHSNQLTDVPEAIGSLTKLKYLDLSRNQIISLPSSLSKLTNLQSLNVEFNKLESLPDMSPLVNLLVLKMGNNNMNAFPASLCQSNLVHLSEVHAPNNQMTDIPPAINKLAALKILDLSGNQILQVPGQLGDCHKLKEINLKGNKLKDRRLQKLIDQCHFKQIMDYIRSHCPRNLAKESSNPSETGDGEENRVRSRESSLDRRAKVKEARRRRRSSSRSSADDSKLDTIEVLPIKENWYKIVTTGPALEIRKIVACLVRNVDLAPEGVLKKFLTLQTNLHSGICAHRQHATIATHDLDRIKGQVTFDVRPPGKIRLTALGRSKETSAAELYKTLNEEADAYRKEKKRQTFSGIHKYLYLLKGKQRFPVVVDEETVISLPPLTNSEATKITPQTVNLLLEVTGDSVPTCKKVLDALLHSMLKLGICRKSTKPLVDCPSDSETVSNGPKTLTVEPIKVVDPDGKLYVQYPSKIDLNFEDIAVVRQKE